MTAPSSISKTATPSPLKIEGNLIIQDVEAAHKLLLSQPTSSMVLDLSAVATCDLTGVQLLLSAQKTAIAAGGKFSVSAYSPAVAAACTGLGLDVSQLSASSL
jgi:anti-anti-sigma regulatory factor